MLPGNAENGSVLPNRLKRRYWSTRKFIQETRHHLATYGSKVTEQTGKSRLRQAAEIVRLASGFGGISASEYYRLQIYKQSPENQRQYIGFSRLEKIRKALGMERWYVVVNDKLMFSILLSHLNLQTPKLFAVYHSLRNPAGTTRLATREDLLTFLASGHCNSFVAKPIFGAFGKGVYVVDNIDIDRRLVILKNGERMGFQEFADALIEPWGEGFLIQEVLRPHPAIIDKCGDVLCCARVILLMEDNGPKIWRALWRMPGPGNMIDNFDNPDTMIAPIDISTGKIGQVLHGWGPAMTATTHHPYTGKDLSDFHLPDWGIALNECFEAATLFPSLCIQAWDIAFTDCGPSLLEVNPVGGMPSPQVAFQKGALDDQLSTYLVRKMMVRE